MILLIIRHGESEADLLKVHEGRADYPLTERGHKQAEMMSTYVNEHYTVNKIYSSTLQRAMSTAKYLSNKAGVDIVPMDDLQEFNNGLLAGLGFEEADMRYPQIKDLPIDKAVYEMESMLNFRTRADRVLNQIISENNANQTVAIISHGKMINQLYASFLGLPVDNKCIFISSDVCLHVLKIVNDRRVVLQSNFTDYK